MHTAKTLWCVAVVITNSSSSLSSRLPGACGIVAEGTIGSIRCASPEVTGKLDAVGTHEVVGNGNARLWSKSDRVTVGEVGTGCGRPVAWTV